MRPLVLSEFGRRRQVRFGGRVEHHFWREVRKQCDDLIDASVKLCARTRLKTIHLSKLLPECRQLCF